jgi:hypothetical protein
VTKLIGVYDTRMSLAPFCVGRLELFKEILIILIINAINAMRKLIAVKTTIIISKTDMAIPPFMEESA